MTTGVSAAPIDKVNNAPTTVRREGMVREGRVTTVERGGIKRARVRARVAVGVRIRMRIGEQEDDVNKRKREVN